MLKPNLRPLTRAAAALCTLLVGATYFLQPVHAATKPLETSGALVRFDRNGQPQPPCPLKHTDVQAEISGSLARVKVVQEFQNPLNEAIEAIYTFPLPPQSAVDDMTMLIGDRTIKGSIKRREEAQAAFEAARRAGHTASLLDQERPNIFTQSVTNIPPQATIKIQISYVETLKFEDGAYEFVYPMVVGPRYMPGEPTGRQGGGWSPDTTRVPDASRISPNVARPGTRAGHDLSLSVKLDAGVPIDSLQSPTHEIILERTSVREANLRLKDLATIPNKDFVLRYDVLGKKIEDAVLLHRDERGGFFTLMLNPPERVTPQEATPKELIFVLDTSGSMDGFPIEKAKESMRHALNGMNPKDTFNLITFAGDTHILFPSPVPATPENLRTAQQFLASRSGRGGTEMMKAIRAALDPSDQQDHIRIVCFMTDGYVGNEFEIIGEVQKHPNARVFSFGIGSSVNRYLLDSMARYGRGEVEYVGLQDDGSAAAKRFHERVHNPLMTDIRVDWGGLPVTEVMPQRIPDLFGAKPVLITGRYTKAANGVLRLTGKMGGRDVTREIRVSFPEKEPRHDVLATLWARQKIDTLMAQDLNGMQSGNFRADLKEQIVQTGLTYKLMTQYTSFVAVEEKVVNQGGTPRRIEVPVEMPEGVSYRGVFGGEQEMAQANGVLYATGSGGFMPAQARMRRMPSASPVPSPTVRQEVAVADMAAMPKPVLAPGANKLHPSLQAVAERVQQKAAPTAAEAKFVKGGKAEIMVYLANKNTATIDELKKAGFEVVNVPGTPNLVIGRIAVEKLPALAALANVRYVAPVV